MRRLVRSQWLTQRHGRLNTACCLSVEGVATTKQRLDRAVGPAAAPCAQIPPRPQRFFNELKSHPKDENQRIVAAREEKRHALRHQRRAGDRLPDRVAVDGAARRFVRIAQEPVVGTSAAGRAGLNGEARILAAQFAGINAYLKG